MPSPSFTTKETSILTLPLAPNSLLALRSVAIQAIFSLCLLLCYPQSHAIAQWTGWPLPSDTSYAYLTNHPIGQLYSGLVERCAVSQNHPASGVTYPATSILTQGYVTNFYDLLLKIEKCYSSGRWIDFRKTDSNGVFEAYFATHSSAPSITLTNVSHLLYGSTAPWTMVPPAGRTLLAEIVSLGTNVQRRYFSALPASAGRFCNTNALQIEYIGDWTPAVLTITGAWDAATTDYSTSLTFTITGSITQTSISNLYNVTSINVASNQFGTNNDVLAVVYPARGACRVTAATNLTLGAPAHISRIWKQQLEEARCYITNLVWFQNVATSPVAVSTQYWGQGTYQVAGTNYGYARNVAFSIASTNYPKTTNQAENSSYTFMQDLFQDYFPWAQTGAVATVRLFGGQKGLITAQTNGFKPVVSLYVKTSKGGLWEYDTWGHMTNTYDDQKYHFLYETNWVGTGTSTTNLIVTTTAAGTNGPQSVFFGVWYGRGFTFSGIAVEKYNIPSGGFLFQ